MDNSIDAYLKSKPVTPFTNNSNAPVHRWYKYPCEFDYTLINKILQEYNPKQEDLILDPFMGVATTSVVSCLHGIDSIGVDAHSYVSWIGKTKTEWALDLDDFKNFLLSFVECINNEKLEYEINIEDESPYVKKLFSEDRLKQIIFLRELIFTKGGIYKDYLLLALVSVLKYLSNSKSNFPYVVPGEKKEELLPLVIPTYVEKVWEIFYDVQYIQNNFTNFGSVNINNGQSIGDARNLDFISNEAVDFVITSPPYLNNIDYADCTRLDMYFLGHAKSWSDLTQQIRSKLIVSASHQAKAVLDTNTPTPDNELQRNLYGEILSYAKKLRSERRKRKQGKYYDLMVVEYFNDMYKSLSEMFRVLSSNGKVSMVIADSAPYGVHIPTDELLGKIALDIGFDSYNLSIIKTRGNKWVSIKGSRRHNVPLRESLLVIHK